MATAADSRTVTLSMPAKPEYVVLARLALSAVCRLTPLAPDEVADLKLAITEATSLLMGSGDPSDTIAFDFALEDDRLVLQIAGPGTAGSADGTDPDEQELSREIIRATADECDDDGTRMRLVKYLRERPDQ